MVLNSNILYNQYSRGLYMKKYILYSFIFFLLFFPNVRAYDLELTDPVISFDGIEHYGLQGFTSTDKYLFVVLIEDGDCSSIIKVFDLDNYSLVTSFTYSSLGHANDVTYNPKTNRIYVLRGGGSTFVDVFSGDTFQYLETIDTKLPIRSITYVDSLDQYFVRTVATGFKLDNQLQLASKMPFVMGLNFNEDIGRQGWSYYQQYIYYTNWSWIRLGGDGANMIYVYDLNGNKKDALYTNNRIGEIEDVAFYQEKMILGFNGYDGKIKFYFTDIPPIPEKKVSSEDQEEKASTAPQTRNLLFYGGIALLLLLVLVVIWKMKKGRI